MDDRTFQFFFWVVTAGVTAAWWWLFKLQGEIAALRLHIAENYPSNVDLQKLEITIDRLAIKVDTLISGLTEVKAEHKASRGN